MAKRKTAKAKTKVKAKSKPAAKKVVKLKSKKPAAILLRLPALEVIDQIGYRSLLLGFPFMTLGLVVFGINRLFHLIYIGIVRRKRAT